MGWAVMANQGMRLGAANEVDERHFSTLGSSGNEVGPGGYQRQVVVIDLPVQVEFLDNSHLVCVPHFYMEVIAARNEHAAVHRIPLYCAAATERKINMFFLVMRYR